MPHIAGASKSSRKSFQAKLLPRDESEVILEAIRYLPAEDQLLIEHVHRMGVAVPKVARMMQTPRGDIYRRLNRIVRRVKQPAFQYACRNLATLTHEQRRVVELVIFHGLSLRQAADQTSLTLHRVRQHIQSVRSLARHLPDVLTRALAQSDEEEKISDW